MTEQPSHTPRRRRWLMIALITLGAVGIAGGAVWYGYGLQSGGHANRLSGEISPYLLLHAHNPVDWYPWGPEALERAKRENKPIFLSVGYSTCYWCHVMERNVFSNPEIAALMNRYFINIKVDREERPDIDEVYMTATQLITRRGGWPNSVFLTPDLKPFYAGTYFPPEDLMGRPGFPRIVLGLADAWNNRRDELLEQAESITKAIRDIQADAYTGLDTVTIDRALVDRAVTDLKSRYDAENGGFGGAPKFPPTMQLELLMETYQLAPDSKTLGIVTHTLDAMAAGGLYDHVGDGFHRYATDTGWHVPHFEKMLYNQADLSRVYLLAYRITKNEAYRHTAEDILTYVTREMTGDDGVFYSAVDSETDTVEGLYYLWTEAQIRDALGDDADLFLRIYALAPMLEGEGKVLYMSAAIDDVAREQKMTPEQLRDGLASMKTRLQQVREQRKRPLVDTKVVTAWNGLMIDAFAYAYEVTGRASYRNTAVRAAEFLLSRMRTEAGDLMRTYRNGTVKYNGYLEDYAFFIGGLLRLHGATGEVRWLTEARALTSRMTDTFWDDRSGGFFFTDGSEPLIVRTKNPYDAAIPSGNATAAHVLLQLAQHTGDRTYLNRTHRLFQAFAGQMEQEPANFMSMLCAVQHYLSPHRGGVLAAASQTETRPPLPLQTIRFGNPSSGPSVVNATLSLAKPVPVAGRPFEAIIEVRMAPGWHINATPPSTKDLIPTTVTFNADVPIQVVSIAYPEGEIVKLAFADRPLSVYQGVIRIRATLRMNPDAKLDVSSRLRATIKYQACSEEVCLTPEEASLSIVFREEYKKE